MREINYDESSVPAYTLPDPLAFADGSAVADAGAWRLRRAEILRLFENSVYGVTPDPTPAPTVQVLEEDANALGLHATRRQVRMSVSTGKKTIDMDLLLYLPAGTGPERPAPIFIGLNFGGNHTVASDAAIAPPRSWVRASETTDEHRASERGRGQASEAWSIHKVVARGYAVATMYYGDIEPDHPEGYGDGVRGLVQPDPAPRVSNAWGALGAWAWGLSRAYDYVAGEPGVDARRVVVMGHSRLGKAALWAGAQDERFALVISNNSGCGGAALSRRQFGESVARINTSFPHWFCPAFRQYNDREPELPVDQHMLLALVAPRPLYVASAEDDDWADPRGEFLAALGADPVYRLFGRDGLAAAQMPAIGVPVMSRIGYHIRAGGHGVTAYDWERFLDFADQHWGAPERP